MVPFSNFNHLQSLNPDQKDTPLFDVETSIILNDTEHLAGSLRQLSFVSRSDECSDNSSIRSWNYWRLV